MAKDKAFCFYYDESLHSLAAAGAELIPFSPLEDGELPACDGIYIGGGYPELYAADLSANVSLRQRLRRAVRAGMPCFAECGGYMYLSEAFYDKTVCLPMVGVVPGKVRMTDRLTRFGYITLTAEKDTFLCKKGDTVRAHEFHYSDSTENGSAFTARKAGGKRFGRPCMPKEIFWRGIRTFILRHARLGRKFCKCLRPVAQRREINGN